MPVEPASTALLDQFERECEKEVNTAERRNRLIQDHIADQMQTFLYTTLPKRVLQGAAGGALLLGTAGAIAEELGVAVGGVLGAVVSADGAEPRFRCTPTDKRFSRVAQSVEKEARVAEQCRSTGGGFRLRFLIPPDVKQEVESYVIDKEGIVISIGPREVSW